MRTLTLLSLLPLALLASCASKESRVETALVSAGLSPRMSECMARRMVDRLSTAQLKRLAAVKSVGRVRGVDGFLRALSAVDDPEAVSVTTRAALHCAIKL